MSKVVPPIKVAIIGGGLAGISMANALMGKAHLSVQVFEAAADFAERGAAVALSTNAQRALERILPLAQEVLEKAGAVTMNPMRMMIVRHGHTYQRVKRGTLSHVGVRGSCRLPSLRNRGHHASESRPQSFIASGAADAAACGDLAP